MATPRSNLGYDVRLDFLNILFVMTFMPLLQNLRSFPINHWVHTSNLLFCFSKPPLIPHTPFIPLNFLVLLNILHIPHFCFLKGINSWGHAWGNILPQLLLASNFQQRGIRPHRVELAQQVADGEVERIWVLTSFSCWINLPWSHPSWRLSVTEVNEYLDFIQATESKTNSRPREKVHWWNNKLHHCEPKWGHHQHRLQWFLPAL